MSLRPLNNYVHSATRLCFFFKRENNNNKKKKERERISGQRQDIGKKKKLRVGVAFKTSMITPHLVKSC